MMPKVSVIIPVYNVEKYLRECLDSVVNQTLKDIEIICVDDGSTDNSLAILQSYANKDARIKIISQKNSGAGPARNVGLKQASGDYIFFLDSDDYIDITTLEKLYKKSVDLDLDICVCNGQLYDMSTNKFINMDYAINAKFLPAQEVFSSYEVKGAIFYLFVGWPWDKLYKSDLIKNNHLEFPEFKNTEDLSFTYLALILSRRISVVNEYLHVYRNTLNSISKSRESEPDAFIKAMDLLRKELEYRNLFRIFKNGFMNYFLTFSLWHLRTITDNKKEELYTQIRQHILQNISSEKDLKFINKNVAMIYKSYISCNNYKAFFAKLDDSATLLQKIFSVKNSENKKHKIIRFCGIKLKIKRK